MTWYKVQQNTPEWLELRKGVLTASKFAKCITDKKHDISKTGIKNITKQLIGESEGTYQPNTFVSEHMAYGNKYEEHARLCLQNQINHIVNEVGIKIISYLDMKVGCSPDGVYLQYEDYTGVEIKCPSDKVYLENLDEIKINNVPSKYFAQIQFSMFVSGFKYWDFVLFRHNRYLHRVQCTVDDNFLNEKIIPVLDEINNNLKEYKDGKRK